MMLKKRRPVKVRAGLFVATSKDRCGCCTYWSTIVNVPSLTFSAVYYLAFKKRLLALLADNLPLVQHRLFQLHHQRG
jgi:hypothetical protein